MTRREQILAALKARLDTLIVEDPSLKVYRNRRAPIQAGPAISIHDGSQLSDIDQTEFKKHFATPVISGFVTAATDDEVGAAANALYGKVIDLLEADVSLGAGAFDVRERSLDFELADEDAKTPTAWFHLTIEIEFTARRVDASQL